MRKFYKIFLVFSLAFVLSHSVACSKYLKKDLNKEYQTTADGNNTINLSIDLSKKDEKATYSWKYSDKNNGAFEDVGSANAAKIFSAVADKNNLEIKPLAIKSGEDNKIYFFKCVVTDHDKNTHDSKVAKLIFSAQTAKPKTNESFEKNSKEINKTTKKSTSNNKTNKGYSRGDLIPRGVQPNSGYSRGDLGESGDMRTKIGNFTA